MTMPAESKPVLTLGIPVGRNFSAVVLASEGLSSKKPSYPSKCKFVFQIETVHVTDVTNCLSPSLLLSLLTGTGSTISLITCSHPNNIQLLFEIRIIKIRLYLPFLRSIL